MEENQKKQPAKRIQLVDVVLERKGSQLFSGRRVRSPEDAANIIRKNRAPGAQTIQTIHYNL